MVMDNRLTVYVQIFPRAEDCLLTGCLLGLGFLGPASRPGKPRVPVALP
jgi:hypothetical protein